MVGVSGRGLPCGVRGLRAWAVAIVALLVLLACGAGRADVAPASQATAGATVATLPADCAATPLQVRAAPAASDAKDSTAPPATGWQAMDLPDRWRTRWPGHVGAAWYDIRWQQACVGTEAMAVLVQSMNMAGTVWINGALLWRDRHLVEPLSRSWNLPRVWMLPPATLHAGENRLLVRVEGAATLDSGLGPVAVGSLEALTAQQQSVWWSNRGLYVVNLVVTLTMGVMFLCVWLVRRADRAAGWFALMSLCWGGVVSHVLMTETAPFQDSVQLARVNLLCFVWYCWAFCRFTWCFGAQPARRARPMLLAVCASATSLLVVPEAWFLQALPPVFVLFVAVFFGNCLQFLVHAWRSREVHHRLLAACYAVFVLVGINDTLVVFSLLPGLRSWSPLASLATSIAMSLVLGRHLAQHVRRIEGFNSELHAHVQQARKELAQTLAREHALALNHTQLQARVRIAHDLHDGLGASLVRSMALVEQGALPLERAQVLSILKLLRDDLRQVIDTDASPQGPVPDSPVIWIAPVRHRFVRLFDALGIAAQWTVPPAWPQRPTALQCLTLMRILEEALSNILKHSRAAQVWVRVLQGADGPLCLEVEDDGLGFDVEAVLQGGLSVGVRSMQARAARLGGQLALSSRPGCTVLRVCVEITQLDEAVAQRSPA